MFGASRPKRKRPSGGDADGTAAVGGLPAMANATLQALKQTRSTRWGTWPHTWPTYGRVAPRAKRASLSTNTSRNPGSAATALLRDHTIWLADVRE